MKVVGLTGGIASGKSTVGKAFKSRGVPYIDMDDVARLIVRPGHFGFRRVLSTFGTEYLAANGEIDRDKLGQLIFKDPSQRRRLDTALRLPLALELFRQLLGYLVTGATMVILDAPLLYESGLDKVCWGGVVVVVVDRDTQAARLKQRDAIDSDLALSKIASQMPLEEKARRATYVLDNTGSRQDTEAKATALLERLRPSFLSSFVSLAWRLAVPVAMMFYLWRKLS
eukprot:TRINITY_DN7839_c0_g1_i1.p1 TRINITY_DN7839_c0_g1~~TRINITY_DN7839_c0_g1_i1.p1  ORF type:complete len:242 (+),score=0.26 TRINITY_DN7839_c0_g1_i1:47-727(+)